MSYNYDFIKLTCPFCKSNMEFLTVLVDELKIPHYIDYFCVNDKCDFNLRIDFDEFEKRTKNIKEVKK